jgi:CRISPR-associated endonuclease/helicase Cas3
MGVDEKGDLGNERELMAHVRKKDDGNWDSPHFLSEHLEGVARLTAAFATKFNSEKWGYTAGIAHDAGKGRLEWQKYLQGKRSSFGIT